MPVREYAQGLGVVLILIGVGEVVLGDRLLLDIPGIFYVPKDLAHLFTGGLLVYLGFRQTDEGLARTAVAGLGVAYLLVGVLGLVLPPLFELSNGYGRVDNIVHLLVGILSLAVAFSSGGNTASKV
jgi:hypothetical protein